MNNFNLIACILNVQCGVCTHDYRSKHDSKIAGVHAINARVLKYTIEMKSYSAENGVVWIWKGVNGDVDRFTADYFVFVF